MENNLLCPPSPKLFKSFLESIDKHLFHRVQLNTLTRESQPITYLHRILEYGFMPYMPAVCEKEIPPLLKLL
jgi:hypothetical protein